MTVRAQFHPQSEPFCPQPQTASYKPGGGRVIAEQAGSWLGSTPPNAQRQGHLSDGSHMRAPLSCTHLLSLKCTVKGPTQVSKLRQPHHPDSGDPSAANISLGECSVLDTQGCVTHCTPSSLWAPTLSTGGLPGTAPCHVEPTAFCCVLHCHQAGCLFPASPIPLEGKGPCPVSHTLAMCRH